MNIYKRLFQYIKPYRVLLGTSIVLMILAGAAEVLVSGVIYITTNGLMNRDIVTLKDIPHLPAEFQISFSVIYIPFIIVAVFVTKGLLTYFANYLMAVVSLKSIRNVQNDMYRHVSFLSCDYFSEKHSGDIMSRIVGDVKGLRSAITSVIIDAVKSPVTLIVTIPVIIIMGGWVAMISLIVFPLVAVPIVMLGRKLRKFTTRLLETNARLIGFLEENIRGMRIIKSFNAEDKEVEKFKKTTDELCLLNCRSFRAIELQRPVIEIMGAVGVAVAIYFALKTLPFDRFMTFAGSLYLLYDPAKKMSKINSVVQQTIASGKRIFEIMDAKPSISEKKDARAFSEEVETIRFAHVDFEYEEGTPVLRDISFSVNKGECIALVGPSGSGKTSVVNLLSRFYDPQKGSIEINDTNIADMTLRSLRNLIGIVTQETVLFSGTLKENISFGMSDATDEQIWEAAQAANAHDFIMDFTKKYETQIGESGMRLSGGQRQRICIARAILKKPQILIFDEATSQLDSTSEKEVQMAIENLMEGRTVFVIAHRLSTVKRANCIQVIENGRIVESGTHESLMKKEGHYKVWYDM